MGMRPRVRIPQALAWLLLVLAILFLVYDLYVAWTYHEVMLGIRSPRWMRSDGHWVSLKAHPNVFWWMVAKDCVALAAIVGGVLVAARRKAMKPRRPLRPPASH
jgi:hypothetical protein